MRWLQRRPRLRQPSTPLPKGCVGCERLQSRLDIVEGILVGHGLADYQAMELIDTSGARRNVGRRLSYLEKLLKDDQAKGRA